MIVSNVTNKMVLGTAQFGLDYGITNLSGIPSEKEISKILDFAWEKGVRSFDTAPGYGSEKILGNFILVNGIQKKVRILTKIPKLKILENYKEELKKNINLSLNNLGCSIDVLFFHNPEDSKLILKEPEFFEHILENYSVKSFGISVYEPNEVELFYSCPFPLTFMFPFNVLDRRFENVNMSKSKRYARSIFLQGLLASRENIRKNSPSKLRELQEKYHKKITEYQLRQIDFAISFVACSNKIDYYLIGVDSLSQLKEILNLKIYKNTDMFNFSEIQKKYKKWIDPRKWN